MGAKAPRYRIVGLPGSGISAAIRAVRFAGERNTAVVPSRHADLADVSKSHTRFDVTLPADVSGSYAGYVRFLAPAKGAYLVVANASTPVQLVDSAGAEVTPTSAAATPACSAAKVQLAVNLDVATYLVKLGPAPQAKVGLLFEAK